MRDAAGQLADGFEALGAATGLLGLQPGGHVLQGGDREQHAAIAGLEQRRGIDFEIGLRAVGPFEVQQSALRGQPGGGPHPGIVGSRDDGGTASYGRPMVGGDAHIWREKEQAAGLGVRKHQLAIGAMHHHANRHLVENGIELPTLIIQSKIGLGEFGGARFYTGGQRCVQLGKRLTPLDEDGGGRLHGVGHRIGFVEAAQDRLEVFGLAELAGSPRHRLDPPGDAARHIQRAKPANRDGEAAHREE